MEQFESWVNARVTVVGGDLCGAPSAWGLSSGPRRRMSVLLHCAADTSFSNTFEEALRVNLLPTAYLWELALSWRVSLFCYVSTAYVSINKKSQVKHPVHVSLPFDVLDLIKHARNQNTGMLKRYEKAMRASGWANTYIMSKVCAEDFLHKAGDRLPTVIVRPSVIGASWETTPGFYLSKKGAFTVATYTVGIGAANIVPHKEGAIDVVPVDYVASTVIVSVAQQLRLGPLGSDQLSREPVIHHAAMGLFCIPRDVMYDEVVKYYTKHPLRRYCVC